VLDDSERVVKVFEERYWTREQHVRALDPFEAFFLCVQARDDAGPLAQICAFQ
jgi:hypothetical protein